MKEMEYLITLIDIKYGRFENNKYDLSTNTWGPKWFKDDDGKLYLSCFSTRILDDGSKVYYLKGDEESLSNHGLDTTSEKYKKLNINEDIGVLIREKVVLDKEGNPIYDSKGKIITEKKYYLDDNGNPIQLKCPWYEPNYPVFDTNIREVNLGTEEEQQDINCQNLKFGECKKVDFEGFSERYSDSTENLLCKSHSLLGGYILENSTNSKYKYTMYVKLDPYGTVQRWLSNSINGNWVQADDRFYVSNDFKNIEDESIVHCSSIVENNGSYKLKEGTLNINSENNMVYAKHYEGSFIQKFGNDTFFYTDHYITNVEDEVGNKNDINYVDNVNKVAGIYYSVLDKNATDSEGNEITDLGTSDDHIRFSNMIKVNLLNTNMRPTASKNNQIRNGGIYRVESYENEKDRQNFKNVVKNATKFNYSCIKSIEDKTNGKVTVVIKSNRALQEKDSNGSYSDWYKAGWRYASEMKSDKSVDINFRKIFNSYSKTTPFGINEIYIYKTFDKNSSELVTLTDMLGNNQTVKVCVDNIIEKDLLGDLNLDGKLDISDLGIMAAYIVGKADFDERQIKVGDLNGDGHIDISDLSILAKIITN